LKNNQASNNNRIDSPRYQDILDVAAKIFKQKGYHHANISDIAAEVGLQKGSLYHYIKSKEDLLYDIFIFSIEQYIKAFSEIIKQSKQYDIILKEAIIAHISPADSKLDRFYVGIHEFHNLTGGYKKIAREFLSKYQGMWLDILEKGKQAGLFSPCFDSKITLFAIFGMCNWSLIWFNPEEKYSRKDLGKMFAERILKGIKVERSAGSTN